MSIFDSYLFQLGLKDTLQGTNISPKNGILKMIFELPQVGYVNSLEGISAPRDFFFVELIFRTQMRYGER